ncbi:HNH endonuclease [Dolichospermum sp. UHCC 0299]|uniref:HNH endonuclease n=1 Tax=unclassified Dolichospermum TaxID=2622029 RepID=UPI003529FACF
MPMNVIRKHVKKCISHYGTSCFVCGFNFGKIFGELGEGFIHVHHLKPLSQIGTEYEVDPVKDLRPVCPNCHAMIHRKSPPLSIDEIKFLIS